MYIPGANGLNQFDVVIFPLIGTDKRIDGGGGTGGTNEGSETEEDIISNLLEQESYLPVSLGEIKAEPGETYLCVCILGPALMA